MNRSYNIMIHKLNVSHEIRGTPINTYTTNYTCKSELIQTDAVDVCCKKTTNRQCNRFYINRTLKSFPSPHPVLITDYMWI